MSDLVGKLLNAHAAFNEFNAVVKEIELPEQQAFELFTSMPYGPNTPPLPPRPWKGFVGTIDEIRVFVRAEGES